VAPASGTYSVSATYAGDANFSSFTSASSTLVTSAPLVAVNLGLSAASSVTGGVDFPATITFIPKTTSITTPTGNITITATPGGASSPSFTTTITAASAFSSGGAAVHLNLNNVGTYTLAASYPGDTTYAVVTASIGITVVAPAKTTPTLTLSIPTVATVGDRLAGSVGYTFAGTIVPSGNLIFNLKSSKGTIIAVTTIPASNARNSLLTALSFTAPASEVYSGYVSYAGDASFEAATSNVITLNVYGAAPTATTLNVSGPSLVQPKTNFNVSVHLTPQQLLQAPPTGNIVLSASNTNVSGNPIVVTVPAANAIAPGGTTAVFQLTNSDVGGWEIDASYDGDVNYTKSAIVGYSFLEFQQSTLVLTPPVTTYAGTATTVTVLLFAGGNPLTGNIFISSSLNGVAGPSANIPAASGTASLNFPSAGNWVLNGTYQGNVSTSIATATVSVVVGAALVGAQFTFSPDDPTVGTAANPFHLSSGVTRDAPLTLTSTGGFTTPVNLTMVLGPTRATVTLVDAAGQPITSTTPLPIGTHISIHVVNPTFNQFASTKPLISRGPEVFVCGLFAAIFFGWRRKKFSLQQLRGITLLGSVLLILGAGSILSGCTATDNVFSVVITATPATSTQGAVPQSITYYIGNDQ
ncbi:MAG: hypothetical protein ABI142_01895, partial [Bryocella sp.]